MNMNTQYNGSMLSALIRLIRPQQWIKNIFVFLPIIFSTELFDHAVIENGTLVFVSFCLISSSVYCINDIVDTDKDRMHPIKKNRPIASGELSVSIALFISIILLILSVFISTSVNLTASLIILAYFVINLAYSLFLKEFPVIDVMAISSGFVLRMLSGTTVVTSSPSSWIFLTTFFLSMFLGFSKRRCELANITKNGSDNSTSRKVLQDYSPEFLDNIMATLIAICIVCYSLYVISDDVLEKFGNNDLIYTIPFVVYGMFYYYIKVCSREMPEDHATALFKSKSLLITLILWIVTCIILIYR